MQCSAECISTRVLIFIRESSMDEFLEGKVRPWSVV